MENRYVFRRVEDDIGSPLNIKDSPHAWLTRRLRCDMREQKDIAHYTEIVAICLSSIAGNPRIDAINMSNTVNDMLIDALNKKLPYTKAKVSNEEKQDEENFDVYFEQLEELKKEIADKKRKENSLSGTGKGSETDNHNSGIIK